MPDYGGFDLIHFLPQGSYFEQEGKGSRVMAEKHNPVFGLQLFKSPMNLIKVISSFLFPFIAFLRQGLRQVDRQRHQGRGKPHDSIGPRPFIPEWFDSQS